MKVIVEEIGTEKVSPTVKRTDICSSCGSLLVVHQYGLYEEAVCMGCGDTATTKPRPPEEI